MTSGPTPAETLQAHLDWAVGPWLGFVFTDHMRSVRELQRRTAGTPSRVIRPRTPQDLRQALPVLLEPPGAPLVWLVALHDEPPPGDGELPGPWTEAADWFLLRANERRQGVLEALQGGLLVVLPTHAKSRVRTAAPDLWSARALVLEPDADAPAMALPPIDPHPLLAATLRRLAFHQRMRDVPFVALVSSRHPERLVALREAADGAGAPIEWLEPPLPLDLLEALAVGEVRENTVVAGPPDALASLPHGVLEAAAFQADVDAPGPAAPLPLPLEASASPLEALDHLVATAGAVWDQGWAAETVEAADAVLAAASELAPSPDVDRRHAAGLELRARAARLQGDCTAALHDIEEAVRLRRRLAGLHGADGPQRRSELARAVSLRGQLLLEAGDLAPASVDLQEALDLRLALARWSDDAETLAELALSWSLLGDLDVASMDTNDADRLAHAETCTREALRLRRRLALETGALRHQRQHGIAWGRLGRVLSRQLRTREAVAAHRQAVAIAAQLAQADPDRITWRMEESVARTQLAAAVWARGHGGDARAEVERAITLRRSLVAEDPTNARWTEQLAVALGQLAEIALHDGDVAAALDAAREAVEHSEALAPTSASQLRGRALANLRLGDVHAAMGATDAAQGAWGAARALLPRLHRVSPARAEAVRSALDLRAPHGDEG